MASRDPAKQALNTQIAEMTSTLEALRPHVLRPRVMRKLRVTSLFSLHAVLGSKHAHFIEDIKTRVLRSPDDYYTDWLDGLDAHIMDRGGHCSRYSPLLELMFGDPKVNEYVEVFIKRTFSRQADDLSKKRPTDSEAEIWLGQNHANYGLLVTPRFNIRRSNWENDRSEIRHFKHPYFTISHVLKTGLVIPGVDKKMTFPDFEHYLQFFEHTLVRSAASKHQNAVAARYVEYVEQASDPHSVPLLLPEVRFNRANSHKYRLDFMVVEPSVMRRIGFELSPWSTHGRLVRTRGMTQKQLNAVASSNREAEMEKMKAYYFELGIEVITFTDKDLADPDLLFSLVARYLGRPPKAKKQQAEVMARLQKHL